MEDDGDLQALLSEQRRELTEAMAIESDSVTAFQLQLQEAMNASLSMKPDVSLPGSSIPTISESDNVTASGLLSEEIAYYEQQIVDQKEAEAEMKIKSDLNRSIHDHAFARELQNVPEREWMEMGDDIHKPYREESLSGGGVAVSDKDSFRVHVKGLIKKEVDGGSKKGVLLAGIGVAICDMNDELVLEKAGHDELVKRHMDLFRLRRHMMFLQVLQSCMGMSTAYGPPKPEEAGHDCFASPCHAINCGVTHLDTADVYGPHGITMRSSLARR